ncbi:ParB/RepB/Spo0J family partition protein [Streptomyces sp. SPB4]|uniref:ParB/RepB/Spo0J family partition protein n=1 Tax=Streptomyces sp. SPB4 TaxID=2940553 RepID=UPI002473425D|nr:ParB/RepB/Spo0J family partition protein [Streptomyces sp. SPB4]MDH6544069.1 ParB family chromosome partitioning protein [Streptomyces sp. SPB4]
MSKRDALGASASFARAAGSRSARRQIEDDAFGGGVPTRLPLHEISSNPDNPRESLGDLSGLVTSLAEVGQIQALTVARIDAFLRDRPSREHDVDPKASYVVIDGHRRLEAAREAGLETVSVHVNDALATTDRALLEAAWVANFHREGLTDLEEGHALQKLVELHGSQSAVSRRIGVSQSYISQRLSLLTLTEELQADLQAGVRTVAQVRSLSSLPPEKQREAADARAQQEEERKRKRAESSRRDTSQREPRATPPANRPGPLVKEQETRPSSSNPPVPTPAPAVVPEPRASHTGSGVDAIDWASPESVAAAVTSRLDEHGVKRVAELLLDTL